jgi:hypothetical protein
LGSDLFQALTKKGPADLCSMLSFDFGYRFSAHSSGIRNICYSAVWIFQHVLDSSDALLIQLSFAHSRGHEMGQ